MTAARRGWLGALSGIALWLIAPVAVWYAAEPRNLYGCGPKLIGRPEFRSCFTDGFPFIPIAFTLLMLAAAIPFFIAARRAWSMNHGERARPAWQIVLILGLAMTIWNLVTLPWIATATWLLLFWLVFATWFGVTLVRGTPVRPAR